MKRLLPNIKTQSQIFLSCKNICQQSLFKERFKVLNQISGKIQWTIRRWYRFCSTCGVWLHMKRVSLCECCGYKVRQSIQSARRRMQKYLKNNQEKHREVGRNYYYKNRELLLMKKRQQYWERKQRQ